MSARLAHDWFPGPLPENVRIGAGSWVHSAYAFLRCRSEREVAVSVGRNSGVYSETFFDLGPEGEVLVGDNVSLVGAAISTNGRVVVGDYALVSKEVAIVGSPFAVPGGLAGAGTEISLGELSWVGTRVVLLPGARLGTGAIVGAGAVVDFPVPDYAVVAGNPARVVGWARPDGRDASERRGRT